MRRIVDPPARLVVERGPDTTQVIAEERVVDAVAVGLVAVGVEAVVALEEHVVGPHHVSGVEPDLDPRAIGVDVAHVHVVVAEHGARAGGARHHDFVGLDRDAVLDQHLGCSAREADGVAGATGLGPGGIVDVELPELDAEGAVDGEALAVPTVLSTFLAQDWRPTGSGGCRRRRRSASGPRPRRS